MNIPFNGSDQFSIGMEMEFQLISLETLDLVDGIVPLMELFPDSPNIKPEFIQNCVEVASKPCRDVAELSADLRTLVAELAGRCADLDMGLSGAGTHPFCTRLAAITPGARYETMERTAGLLGHRQITFATHVHLGVPSGDEAVWLAQRLGPYLPMLLALSASSPFWQGHDTAFAAFRPRILASARSYGLPPDFGSWAEFEKTIAGMARAGKLKTVNDVHWYIRPRPGFGTVEVRIMDAQPSVADALAIAALLRALVGFLKDTRDQPGEQLPSLKHWVLRDNCFLASRFGLDARVAVNDAGDATTLEQLARSLLDRLAPYAQAHRDTGHLERLAETVAAGIPCERQRRVYAKSGSLKAVTEATAAELSGDLSA